MKERPIIFSGEMVRAILEGRKTQTRRVIKPQMEMSGHNRDGKSIIEWKEKGILKSLANAAMVILECPYGQPGDRLWVQETWAKCLGSGFCQPFERYLKGDQSPWGIGAVYKATPHPDYRLGKWSPSVHMPRWASRITLEIAGIRVERLQDISEKDAIAEGATFRKGAGWCMDWSRVGQPVERKLSTMNYPPNELITEHFIANDTARGAFFTYIESVNKDDRLVDKNPWVWVVEFPLFKENANG